jgi:hypothetical protein
MTLLGLGLLFVSMGLASRADQTLICLASREGASGVHAEALEQRRRLHWVYLVRS